MSSRIWSAAPAAVPPLCPLLGSVRCSHCLSDILHRCAPRLRRSYLWPLSTSALPSALLQIGSLALGGIALGRVTLGCTRRYLVALLTNPGVLYTRHPRIFSRAASWS